MGVLLALASPVLAFGALDFAAFVDVDFLAIASVAPSFRPGS
jgi:hypothetical protein